MRPKNLCKMKATSIFCPLTCEKSYQRDEREKDTTYPNSLNSTKSSKNEYDTISPKSINNSKAMEATKGAKSSKSGKGEKRRLS